MIEPEQIKKLRVRYLKCNKGDLHQGEVLNFICIDPNCKNKGLICPVCQTTNHEGHQTLHLKLFLSEVNRTLYHADESQELSGLAEYLCSLDSSKKEMMKSLKGMVDQLSQKVRELQQKIENSYCLLRKIVLSQSTVSMRLPELYRLLTQQDCVQDEEEIFKQITRYSQLLQFKNNKLITVDSAKNLVVEYASKAGSLSAHLTTVVSEVTKIFNNLPLDVNKFGLMQAKAPLDTNLLTFSPIEKSMSMNVVKTTAQLLPGYTSGIVFTVNNKQPIQKAAFRITEGNEGECIIIGVANPDNYKLKNYQINIEEEPGLYGLNSIGFLQEELEGSAFTFTTGDTIDVTWTVAELKLVIQRRYGVEQSQTFVPIIPGNENMTFFIALSSDTTKVQLVQ